MTSRLARGRSLKDSIPAGFSGGTMSTSSLCAKMRLSRTRPSRTSACMCAGLAEAKTSAGAPCSICRRSTWLPANSSATSVPGWAASKARSIAVKLSAREEAA